MSGTQGGPRFVDDRHRYRLESRIATGGMGEVWRATDTSLGREVAVKVLKSEYADDPLFRSRFETEARHAASLHHPGVASVYDVGEFEDRPYIVMELLKGQTLRDKLLDGSVKISQILDLGIQVADALDAAHTQGIIHRDIKPANIVFDQKNRRVRVMDFGVARLENSRATRTGVILGSPSYMAPEQLDARPVTPQSDLFSLGVTLFQLLTGMLPFRSDSIPGLMQKISAEPHPPLRVVRPDLPASLAAILDRALDKDPDARYRSGAEMAQALRDCARDIDPALR